MATSSISKNFIVETKEQVERFLNAIETSYQQNLNENNNDHGIVINANEKEIVKRFLK